MLTKPSNVSRLKSVFLIVIASTFLNCKSKKEITPNSLHGDWYLFENTIAESFDYQEVSVKEDNIYIFLSSNYAISFVRPFHLDKTRLYFLGETKKDTISNFEISLYENEFVLQNSKGKIVYRKIKGDTLLSNYMDGNISKEIFDEGFTRRLEKSN